MTNRPPTLALHSVCCEVILDVGGEGRHPEAWNLNPSRVQTIGKARGQPIPRRIPGRADAIPFDANSVLKLIVERTPLSVTALREIARVIAPNGIIVLRHAQSPIGDPHAVATRILPGKISQRMIALDGQILQETEFHLARNSRATEVQDDAGILRLSGDE